MSMACDVTGSKPGLGNASATLSRIRFRLLALPVDLPGVRESSW
jgi:ribosomal protein S14